MLLKLFGWVFSKLIADLNEEQKGKARQLFLDLVAVITEGAVKGARK